MNNGQLGAAVRQKDGQASSGGFHGVGRIGGGCTLAHASSHGPKDLDITRVDENGRDTGDRPSSPYRVVVIDDHQLLGETLAEVLRLLGTDAVSVLPTSVEEARTITLAHDPDVVVADFHLGDMGDSTALIAAIAESGIPVIVVTGDGADATKARCLEVGAAAVMSKGIPTGVLLDALTRAIAGERLVSDAERYELVGRLRRLRKSERRRMSVYDALTPREADVLRMLCEGLAAAEIAEASYVSLTTVRSQIRAVLMKLDVSSQLAATAMAHRDGWVARPTSVSSFLTMTSAG